MRVRAATGLPPSRDRREFAPRELGEPGKGGEGHADGLLEVGSWVGLRSDWEAWAAEAAAGATLVEATAALAQWQGAAGVVLAPSAQASAQASEVRVLFGGEVWALPSAWLEPDPAANCGPLARHSHLWDLAVRLPSPAARSSAAPMKARRVLRGAMTKAL